MGYLAKPLILPDAKSWRDVFKAVQPYDAKKTPDADEFPMGDGTVTFGTYCAASTEQGHKGLRVRARHSVLEKIARRLVVDGHLHWRAIERSDGILITVEYDQIIGSRYIALVDDKPWDAIEEASHA